MGDEPRLKRQKISRGKDDFLVGNIIEIELSNFMTFSHLKCKPGSRLNLVIGPNGSGKSSLVCAIALGLGGDPQVLGRATSIGAYVKRGEDSGYIKICLRGDNRGEQITVMRKIDTRNKSEWVLNGKVVPKKDLIEMIQRFNIQVNNLTQFLPQDRVCEFAKLSPIQLLEETEKAVGDPQLPVLHRSLITKSQEIKKFERAVETNKESLQQLKTVNAELERDVERVRQRKELLKQVDSMEKKLPWLEFDIKQAEHLEIKKQTTDAKRKLEEAAKTLNELKKPIERLKKEKTAHSAEAKKISGLLDDNMKKRMQILEDDNRLAVQIKQKYIEMEDLGRQEASRQQRIFQAKEALAAAELELANLPAVEPPKDTIDGLATQILELEATAREMKSQKTEKEKQVNHFRQTLRQCVERLKNMESTNNKRLHALQKSGAEKIFEAYDWVQEHRNKFKREVYGPVLIEVNVMDQQTAAYLEGHIAHYVWKAFITQDPDDRDLLFSSLKPFNVPIINHVGDENRHEVPFQVTEEMKMLGIKSRLDQVFDAPVAVKEVLISQFALDYSYIGSRETDKRADAVLRLGIMDLWTPDNHYRWKTSRYGNHVSASVDSVEQSRLIICNADAGEIEKIISWKMELEGKISSLDKDIKAHQSKLRHVEDERAKLEKEREEILSVVLNEQKRRRKLENLVSQWKSKLESIAKEESLGITLANLTEKVKEMKIRRFQLATKIKHLLTEAVAYKQSFAEVNMSTIELEAKIKDMEASAKQQENTALQASLHFENCKRELESSKQRLESARERAESIAPLTPGRKEEFRQMPATIEELKTTIDDLKAQANSILCLNQNILEEYESRQQKIEALTSKQEADEKELHTRLDEINSLKGDWLPTLRKIVAQINSTFSRNFQEMAVAGEVSLDERGMDFDQYGILIKVKFRQAGQLQELSAYHQSGGERSVSTILYLVSLQDLTNCPFRVVDEINQGMDPINERKMFQQLVRAASQPNTPQCFLLTPKLLPNLEYSEACSILTVMNGPWIEKPSKVWSNGKSYGAIMELLGRK